MSLEGDVGRGGDFVGPVEWGLRPKDKESGEKERRSKLGREEELWEGDESGGVRLLIGSGPAETRGGCEGVGWSEIGK